MSIRVREKPPLRLHANLETSTGKFYRWSQDEPKPANVPSGLRHSDTMPGGYESCDCVLPRKPGVDYADLERLSTLHLYGAGGEKAGEYRLERAPRTSGDQMAISPSAVGWQAHLEDDKSAREIYVDRDLSHWTDAPVPRRIRLTVTELVSLGEIGWQQVSGWQCDFPTSELGAKTAAELWYGAPTGLAVAALQYAGDGTGTLTGWVEQFHATDNEDGTSTEDHSQTLNSTVQTFALATPRRYVYEQLYSNNNATTPTSGTHRRLPNMAVFGDHGIPTPPVANAPDGVYASDVVADAVRRWAPLLVIKSESVQPSGFVIPHLVFLEPTTSGEIVRQATRFGLQDWGVWDDREFVWHQRGARGRRWRARISPAQLEETGPQVDRLWESVIVQYQDVDGSTKTVGPPGSGADTEDAVLKDDDPDNPANRLGIVRRDLLQMGVSTAAGATELGRRFLEEAKLLDSSGRARFVGHVESDRGVLYPYWAPRSGDYVSFIDASDTSYRRIVRSEKDQPTRTCSVDLDSPPEGLQALLERLGAVLIPLGL